MKSFLNYLKELNTGASNYLAKRIKNKDRGTKPNPEPKTERQSLPGLPRTPRA